MRVSYMHTQYAMRLKAAGSQHPLPCYVLTIYILESKM